MRDIALYRPGKDFPSLSVTGGRCELMCRHCQGRYLKGMLPVLDPPALERTANDVLTRGGSGVLISGGCDAQGKVPLQAFLPALRRARREKGLLVNIHPGLVSPEEASDIAASADRISFDLVLDEDAIRSRMNLDRTSEDYMDSFRALCQAAPGRVAPHVLLGIGQEENEMEAVRQACREKIPCLILLSLLNEKVADWDGRLVRAVEEGAGRGRPVVLGCMRPRGRADVEMAALYAGAEGIANPSSALVPLVRKEGWKVQEHRLCCALHRYMPCL